MVDASAQELHRLQLSILDAAFRGRRADIEHFWELQGEDDGCVSLRALQLFCSSQLPAPLSDAFVHAVLRDGGMPASAQDGPAARIGFDQCMLLLQGVTPQREAAAPLPALGPDSSMALIHAHMSAGKRDLRKQRRQRHKEWSEEMRLRKKRAALGNVHCTWHPRIFDAAGDEGNVRDKDGRKAACAWDLIRVNTDNSHNKYSAAFVAKHPKGPGLMSKKEPWRPMDGSWKDPPPLEMMPDKCVKHVESELRRAVNFAQTEFAKTNTKTLSQCVVYSQCKSDVHQMQVELEKIRAECKRRQRKQQLRRRKAERQERKESGHSSGTASGLLPQLVLDSSHSATRLAVGLGFGSRPPSRAPA